MLLKKTSCIIFMFAMGMWQMVGANEFEFGILTYKNSPFVLLSPKHGVVKCEQFISSQSQLESVIDDVANNLPFILTESLVEAARKAKSDNDSLNIYRDKLYLELALDSSLLTTFYNNNRSVYELAVANSYGKKYLKSYISEYSSGRQLFLSQFLNAEIIGAIESKVDASSDVTRGIQFIEQQKDNLEVGYLLSEYIFLKATLKLLEKRR